MQGIGKGIYKGRYYKLLVRQAKYGNCIKAIEITGKDSEIVKQLIDQAWRIKIGNYYISRYTGKEGGIWIEQEDGEGGRFCEKGIAELIDKFYKDNF